MISYSQVRAERASPTDDVGPRAGGDELAHASRQFVRGVGQHVGHRLGIPQYATAYPVKPPSSASISLFSFTTRLDSLIHGAVGVSCRQRLSCCSMASSFDVT